MATLLILSGKLQGKKLSLPEKNVTIGRDEDCELRVASTEVSRRHCVLMPSAQGLIVRDLDSPNGTFINEVRIEGEQLLSPGGILQVGPMQFQLVRKKPPTEKAKVSDSALSDDDIASWLGVDEASSDSIDASDTTIISNPPKSAASPPRSISPPKKKQFKSIGDEAADIIRRHWENLNADQSSDSPS
ncbi:MAG: FHA domain-containing protein [Planctomycetota bacterium]|nr:FHA domain-containing protein [Planctomycetota bacterium]MDA1213453.1 FHA domain-containing protein [Planctomycetota bacterium]